jgi:serine protease Do
MKITSLFHHRAAVFAAGLLAAGGLYAAAHSNPSGSTGAAHRLDIKVENGGDIRGPVQKFSYAPVVKRVAPSVVKITVEMKTHNVSMQGGNAFPFSDPFFRQFFGNQFGGQPPMIQEAPETALGSGVIVSPNGYIVTNNHVVRNARVLTVSLADGRQFKAHVVGRDPQTDIAVIKIDAEQLPAITFAPSNQVEVGDRVLAIGNPFGIGETVTTGIVSATGRRAGLGLAYEDFIQTDAAINPGNSGGALVDADGRLIGINTAILSKSGGFQGVGLAIPSDLVRSVANSLVAHGRVNRGYLGITVQDLTPTLADSFGVKGTTSGALVSGVRDDSPAAKAGLKSGDVILEMNGQAVEGASQLSLAVAEAGPNAHLSFKVLRDGKPQTVQATTTAKPGDNSPEGLASSDSGDQGVLQGVGVSDIDPSTRSELNIPTRLQGAVITQVDPNSAAAQAGLKPGDIILEINRHPVRSAQDAVSLSQHAQGKHTLVKLWSHGNTVYVVVDESGTPGDTTPDGP